MPGVHYVYANVDYIETTQGSRIALLKGYNPSDCFEFDRVQFISNERDTYSVLPIMKQVREFCPMKMVPFEILVVVPRTLSVEKLLLHVRVMNGKSVNAIFENE